MSIQAIRILCFDDLCISEDDLNAALNSEQACLVTYFQDLDRLYGHLEKQPCDFILIGDLLETPQKNNLIKDLVDRYPHIPQIVYSGNTGEAQVVAALQAGAANYIARSDLARLGSVIKVLFDQKLNQPAQSNDTYPDIAVDAVTSNLPGTVYQIVRDKTGKMTMPYTSAGIGGLTSLARDELREDATPVFGDILEKDRQRILDSIEESARNMTLWEEDFQIKSPDDKPRWIRGISTPKRQADGSVVWNGLLIDVSKERALQEDLEKTAAEKESSFSGSETSRQAVLDTVVDGILTIDNRGRIESANKATLAGFGYKENELIGNNISMLMKKTDADEHDAYISRFLKTGKANIIDNGRRVEGLRKDGSIFPLDLSVSEMTVNGERKFTGILRDITDKLKTETELRKNEERLRLSQDFSNLVTWEWNIKTGDMYWSHRLDGKGLGEGGLQLKFQDFIDNIFPEDKQKVTEAIQLCLETGSDYFVEHRTMRADGLLRWVQEKGNVVRDRAGSPERMIGIAQDITEQKKSEHKLKEAQQLARLGHWEFEFKEQTISWSDDIYDLFGLDKETIKPSLEIFFGAIHKDDLESVKTLADEDVLAEFPEQDIDCRLILAHGETRWVHLESQTQFDQYNQVTGLRGIVQDITERKHAELDLIESKNEAEKAKAEADLANKSKSVFLSRMSHELRTPLNAILGFTQLLELEQDLSVSQGESVSEIHIASDHLLDLINDVLDLSKIESGKAALSIEPVKIANLFSDCESMINALAEKDKIQIDWIAQKENQHFIYVDRIRIKQVLLNLLSNAIKYNRPEGCVHISTEIRPEKTIRINVHDTGYGIPLDQQENLFQSFNRLGAEFSDIEGTGIGLVIAKRLIEMMGGAIGFQSDDKGTTFWIDTPLTRTKEISLTQIDELEGSTESHNVPASSFTILYMEGSSNHLRLIQQIMARRPVVNLISTHIHSLAMKLAINKSPDLLLVDVNFPGTEDLSLVREFKKNKETKNIPVIALSSGDLLDSVDKAIRREFDEYMTKPVNVRKLLSILDRMFNRKNSMNQEHKELSGS